MSGETAETLFNRALDHHDREAFDEAIDSYKRAIELDPGLVVAHNNLGMVYIDKAMFDEAVEALLQTIKLDENYAEAYNNLGFALRRLGRDGKAAACYDKFLGMEPEVEDGPKIQSWVDQVKAQLGTLPPIIDEPPPPEPKPEPKPEPESEAPAGQAAPVAPAAPDAPATPSAPGAPAAADSSPFGDLSGAPAESAQSSPFGAAGAAPEQETETAEAICEQGIAEFEKDNLEGAEEILRRALAVDDSLAVVHSALGRVLAKASRFMEAATELTQAVSLDPADAAAFYVLGFTYRSLGQDADAAQSYERYLELTPDAAEGPQIRDWIAEVRQGKPLSPMQMYEQASALYQQGNLDQSLEMCEQIVVVDESFASAGLLLGQILVQKEDFIRAVPALKRAERAPDVSPEVHFYLGQAYEKRGMPDDARAAYEKYLSLAPDGPNAEAARRVTQKVTGASSKAATTGPRCQFCYRPFTDQDLQTHEGKKICPDCMASMDAAAEPAPVSPALRPSVVEVATKQATASRARKQAIAKAVRYGAMFIVVIIVGIGFLLLVLRLQLLSNVFESMGVHSGLKKAGLEPMLSSLGIEFPEPGKPDVTPDGGGKGPDSGPDTGTGTGETGEGPDVTPVKPPEQKALIKLPAGPITAAPMAPFRLQLDIGGEVPENADPEYELKSGPEGMSIDPVSGLILWDPQKLEDVENKYTVEVFASLTPESSATAQFDILMQFGFRLGQVLETGAEPGDDMRMVSGSLGGEGKGLAVTWGKYRRGGMRIYRRSGDASQLTGGSPIELKGFASAMAVGDFTGDGRGDLAITDWFAKRLLVYAQSKTGEFEKVKSLKSRRGIDCLVAGDLDFDGKQDVVASSWTESYLSVYLQRSAEDGKSGLVDPKDYRTGSKSGWNRVFIGPIKGGMKAVYLLSGSGKSAGFKAFKMLEDGLLDVYTSLTSEDFAVSQSSETKLLRGGKEGPHLLSLLGGNRPVLVLLRGKNDAMEVAARLEVSLPPFPLGMVTADMNGDRSDDVIVLYPEEVRVYLSGGKPEGPYTGAAAIKVPHAVGPMVVGDFTGDGKPDIAVARDDSKIQIVEFANSQGTVTP